MSQVPIIKQVLLCARSSGRVNCDKIVFARCGSSKCIGCGGLELVEATIATMNAVRIEGFEGVAHLVELGDDLTRKPVDGNAGAACNVGHHAGVDECGGEEDEEEKK